MVKYIDREMAIEICDWYEHTFAECEYAIRPIADDLKKLPVADVRPVRHGQWIHDGLDFPHGNDWIHCSECGKRGINVPADLTDYCPNCGARMDGEQNG